MRKTKYDIFISYRRENGADTAKHLRDVLVSKGYSVFFDTDSLRSGSFNHELINVINNCKDFILILSPNSLDRCINDGDWVRQEIACALNSNKNIIPVMSSKFSFPDELPSDIDDVRWKNGVTVNIEYFDAMVEKLLSFLHSKTKKRTIIPLLSVVVLACVILTTILLINRSSKKQGVEETNASGLSIAYVQQLTNEGLAALDSGDYLTALQRLRVAAEEGDHVALCNLGYMYSNGLGVELSHETALELYKKAMEQGDIVAITNIGFAYEKGLGIEQSYEKAIEYYMLAVEKGDIRGASYLGYMYENGFGVEKSYEKAAEYYLMAADSGDQLAQLGLAYLYENGLGVEKSHDKALYYFNLSKEQEDSTTSNDTSSSINLSTDQSENGDKDNNQTTQEDLNNSGNEAFESLSIDQLLKKGMDALDSEDYTNALQYFQAAANRGDAFAQSELGFMYRWGLGVEQSEKRAAEYYQLAADQGYGPAFANLGLYYAYGIGVEHPSIKL